MCQEALTTWLGLGVRFTQQGVIPVAATIVPFADPPHIQLSDDERTPATIDSVSSAQAGSFFKSDHSAPARDISIPALELVIPSDKAGASVIFTSSRTTFPAFATASHPRCVKRVTDEKSVSSSVAEFSCHRSKHNSWYRADGLEGLSLFAMALGSSKKVLEFVRAKARVRSSAKRDQICHLSGKQRLGLISDGCQFSYQEWNVLNCDPGRIIPLNLRRLQTCSS